ncbi:hypothetical protein ACQPZJ_32220 [Actinoplanes sp. CA-054009]
MGIEIGGPEHHERASTPESPPTPAPQVFEPRWAAEYMTNVAYFELRPPPAAAESDGSLPDFHENVGEQAALLAAEHFADTVTPGAGLIVAASYVAVKAIGTNPGRDFMVMIPAPGPGTELGFAVRVSPAEVRVDLMGHVYIEDAAAEARAAGHGSWPDEWTLEFGLAGIRDHGAVPGRVVPLRGGVPHFIDKPTPDNRADWEMSPAKRWRVSVPGCDPRYVS